MQYGYAMCCKCAVSAHARTVVGHFYGARNGVVAISPKKVNQAFIQVLIACFEAKFTPIIDYRQIFLM
jgi:hypothetical protein